MSALHGDPTLGMALRMLREYAHLSQEGLARRMACSSSSVSGWETGKVMPETASVRSLLEALGLPAEALRAALLFVADLRVLERDEALSPFAGLPSLQVLQRLGIEPREGEPPAPGEFRDAPTRLAAEIDRRSYQIGKGAERSARAFFHALRSLLASEARTGDP